MKGATSTMKSDLGLLILRICTGGIMFWEHGWEKLRNFSQVMGVFPDPIGLGSTISLALVVFAETFCSIAIVLGIKVQWAVVPLIINMLIAAFVYHAHGTWAQKELPYLYAVAFIVLMLTGPGKYSLENFYNHIKAKFT